jgi:HK97 family phage prohead protease
MRNGILHRRPFFSVKTAAVAPMPTSDRRSSARPEKRHIVVGFAVKADSIDTAERTFEGLASVWGKDLGDDNMKPGAFKKTIKEWKAGTDAIPLLNSHNHWDVLSAVGQLIDAKETTDGLWTKWEIIPGPDGDRILERIRPGSNGRSPVGKMSIGFEPTKVDFEESDTARFGQVRNLNEVRLKEVSLVLFPMAPGASIDSESVKSFTDELSEVKVDEVDDETKAALRKLASRIGAVLAGQQKKGATTEPAEPKAKPPAPVVTPTSPAPKAAAAPQSTTGAEAEGDGETGTEGKKGGEGEDPPVDEHAGKYKFAEALTTRILSVSKKAAITTS